MVTLYGDNVLGLDDERMAAYLQQNARVSLDPAAAFELDSDFRETHGAIAKYIGNLASGQTSQYRAGIMVGAALMAEVVDGTLLEGEFEQLASSFMNDPYEQLVLF